MAAGILSLRMLGLFMVLPVFVVYASQMDSAGHAALLGLALGAYGLTQALLQVPLGRLSDRWGRRRVIAFGLLVFVVGSAIAATSDSLGQLIAGRLLQGAGAVSSAVLALVGDATAPRWRSLSMALVGMAMGGAFLLSLVVGPALANLGFVLDDYFWLAAVLGLASLLLVAALPGAPPRDRPSRPAPDLGALVLGPKWRPWNIAIFVIHVLMAGCFVAVPLLLVGRLGLPVPGHAMLYLTTLLVSCVVAMPLLVAVERRWSDTAAWPIAALLLVLGLGVLVLLPLSYQTVWAGLLLFFAGFNLLEAGLPAGVSRRTQAASRGLVMGVFASHQFLGAFAGGVLGGALLAWGGPERVLVGLLCVALLWALYVALASVQSEPDEYIFESGGELPFRLADREAELLALPGVRRVRADEESGTLIVEFDRGRFRAGPVWDLLESACPSGRAAGNGV